MLTQGDDCPECEDGTLHIEPRARSGNHWLECGTCGFIPDG